MPPDRMTSGSQHALTAMPVRNRPGSDQYASHPGKQIKEVRSLLLNGVPWNIRKQALYGLPRAAMRG